MTRPRAAALLVLAALSGSALSQDQPRRDLPGLSLGPRLLEYPVECVDPRGCRIECFQQGVKVVARTGIGVQDEVRLFAATGESDQFLPRWFEIRPFDGNDVQTLLLTRDTFCDLKSLVISPKPRS